MDYFLARYYSSTMGRFTSIDPIIMAAERLADPQQINLYAYTRNNPLKYIDPFGEKIQTSGSTADQQRYATALSKKTGLKLTTDKKGKVKFDGKEPNRKDLSGAALKIYNAIKSDKTVNISLEQNNGTVDFGSPYSLDSNGNLTTSVQTIDFADIDRANPAQSP